MIDALSDPSISNFLDGPVFGGQISLRPEVTLAVFDFIEGWYSPHRRHVALDYLSPLNYKKRYALAS
jgi:hypothetical protein